jgi:hypothetical protein
MKEVANHLAAELLLFAGLVASPAEGGTHTSGLFVEFTATRNQEEVPESLSTKEMCLARSGRHTFEPELRVENDEGLVITDRLIGFEFTMTLARSGTQPTLERTSRWQVTRRGIRRAAGPKRFKVPLEPSDCVRLTFAPASEVFLLRGEVLTASLFLTREPPPPWPEQPIENPANGHYYEWVVSQAAPGQGTTWEMARAEAESRSFNGWTGYLVTITDAEEDAFLIENFPIGAQGEIWLGGSDEGQEGDWYWITGEAWGYENWAPGEPNNIGDDSVLSSEENCLEYRNWYPTPQWNDLPCDDHNSSFWIVEYGEGE